jgi:urease subunit beta
VNAGAHPSDDPGTRSGSGSGHGTIRHPSSGPGGPSLPRRPGTSERQAPRRSYPADTLDLEAPLVPGEVLYAEGPVVINEGKDVVRVRVANTGDRPIQVGSHYHFAEANPALDMDRDRAWGRRLNILSGGSVRFEPGAVEEVELIPIAGQRIVVGLRGQCAGPLDG